MPNLLYLAPADMYTLYGTVAGDLLNSTYQRAWLVDGLPGRPLHGGTVSPSWTVTNTAKPVNFITVLNSNIDATKTINITGDVTTSLTMPAYAGRLPMNPFTYYTPDTAGVDSLTVSVSGNTVAVVMGDFVAGKARELERPIGKRGRREFMTFNVQPDLAQMGNIGVTRKDMGARTLTGSTVLTAAGMTAVQAWFDSTNDGELMSIIVPDPTVNDAWAVKFQSFGFEKGGPDEYFVELKFVEFPRFRW